MTLRTLKRFSDSMSSVRFVCVVLPQPKFQILPHSLIYSMPNAEIWHHPAVR